MPFPRSTVAVLRSIRNPALNRPHHQLVRPVHRSLLALAIPGRSCRKQYSQELKPSKIYFFKDIQSHLSNPKPDRILVDTREPSELQATGTIPGSLNIPITSKPDSFHITAEEFEERFGFERPKKEDEVVFYCKAGVRSRAAAELAKQAGWTKVAEYSGSWLDWEKNGGKREGVR